jgi:hypothetical protein
LSIDIDDLGQDASVTVGNNYISTGWKRRMVADGKSMNLPGRRCSAGTIPDFVDLVKDSVS